MRVPACELLLSFFLFPQFPSPSTNKFTIFIMGRLLHRWQIRTDMPLCLFLSCKYPVIGKADNALVRMFKEADGDKPRGCRNNGCLSN